MGSRNIKIEPNSLITDRELTLNILSNKVWWYDNNQLRFCHQYLGSKHHGVSIMYYRNNSLRYNVLFKDNLEI